MVNINRNNTSNGLNRAMSSNNGAKNLDIINNITKNYNEDELKNVPLNLLEDYPNHHYKAYGGIKFENLCDSILRSGIYDPLIVNFKDNHYYILSGHNRRNALKKIYQDTNNEKYNTAPCIIKKDLDETTCELIVQECNLIGRNFEDMDLQERCENIHEYYEAVYNYYQKHKDNIPKGFQTREEVGNRLGMNYKTVERYNRIYKVFNNNTSWYSYFPNFLDLIDFYELCKLNDELLSLIFTKLDELKANNTIKKIKLSQIKNIVKLQNQNKYSNEELVEILFNGNNSKEKKTENIKNDKEVSNEIKLPIDNNYKFYDKYKNLSQEQVNMLEMRLMTELDNFFTELG